MLKLEDRVAIITGATGGIGGELARAFAAEGAKLVLTGRREVRLQEIVGELHDRACVTSVVADLARPRDAERLAAQAIATFGRIDVLVNNAGAEGPTVGIEALEPSMWQEVIDSNLTSTYLCCRAVAPTMMQQRSGRIVNLSSCSGKRPLAYRVGYCAAKLGVIGFTRALAEELGPYGITVNAICPGAVQGDRIGRVVSEQARIRGISPEEAARSFTAGSPLGRFVRASSVAAVAVHLAGPDGDDITGEDVNVSAGLVMY